MTASPNASRRRFATSLAAVSLLAAAMPLSAQVSLTGAGAGRFRRLSIKSGSTSTSRRPTFRSITSRSVPAAELRMSPKEWSTSAPATAP